MTQSTTVFDALPAGNVKAAMNAAGAKSSDLWMVPVKNLRTAPGFNVRQRTPEYEAKVAWLTGQMVANGYMREAPMSGYVVKENATDIIYITAGHRRFEAVHRAIEAGAAIERVPVITHPAGTSVEDLTVKLVTENSGEPLSPMEIAFVCKRLQGYGLDEKDISHRLGYTITYVKQLFELLAAPKPVRDMVEKGQVSATLASEVVRKKGNAAAQALADGVQKAREKGKTRATKKDVLPDSEKARPPTFDFLAHLRRQFDLCERTFGPESRCDGFVHVVKPWNELWGDPTDGSDWIDVMLAAIDGAWRTGFTPEQIVSALQEQQLMNESRTDWRTSDPDKTIEHDRAIP